MKLTRGERFKDARNNLPKNERSMDMVRDATGVNKSLIQALEDDENDRDVGYSKVVSLARHYKVSTDYLLGLTDVPTTDVELKAVCDLTGLSEQSIEQLNFLNSKINDVYPAGFTDDDFSPIDLINVLIQDEYFFVFLVEFCQAVYYQKNSLSNSFDDIIKLQEANPQLVKEGIELVSFREMAEYKRLKSQDFLNFIWMKIIDAAGGKNHVTENDT